MERNERRTRNERNVHKNPGSHTERRIRLVRYVMAVLLAALTARTGYWQLVCGEALSEAAVSQYQTAVEGLDTRGAIVDRNLQPLTGGIRQYYYFLKQDRLDVSAQQLLAALHASLVSASKKQSTGYAVYRTSYFEETVSRQLQQKYGAYLFSGTARYADSQPACHLIGYLNQSENRGVSGLEQKYEALLQPDGRTLTLWADGAGSLLLDQPPKQTGKRKFVQNQLVTTLDRNLQEFCETLLEDGNLEGAVLVSEAETGEVLAWVSAPSFNPNAIDTYLAEGGTNLVNKCMQGLYAPGSVFKVVVAAAALESGAVDPDEPFTCSGTTEVGGVTLGCQAGPEGGHGQVDLYQAMAVSCNCYFAQLGAQIGTEAILSMAEKLGFGAAVMEGFPEEAEGFLPAAAQCGPWDISNLSIGQGQILVTPLQVHQMMSATACGGMLQPLTVVKEAGGAAVSGFGAKSILSASAADALDRMLRQVMNEGTGHVRDWNGTAAGKTGTAEALKDGISVNNCWFSGYFHTESQCFVVTVLIEDGNSSSASAVPIFQRIYEYMQK